VLRARAAGLDWPQVEAKTDDALEGRLYGRRTAAGRRDRPWPDCAYVHAERRKPGITLELLHLEYLEQQPDGYHYTQFCEIYRASGVSAPRPVFSSPRGCLLLPPAPTGELGFRVQARVHPRLVIQQA
jgi:hypothetical protein